MTNNKSLDKKRACLVYVAATEDGREEVRRRLEQSGYAVCEVKAEHDVALAAQAGHASLPDVLMECIAGSNLCLFLLPEEEASDGCLSGAAGLASRLGKRIIGIVAGTRIKYPESFGDSAGSMLRVDSDRLDNAISGSDFWERQDRSLVVDRPIKHVRCQ